MASSSSSPPTTDEPKRPDENDAVLEQQQVQEEEVTERIVKEKECVHKTKTIQFMNRSTPIILQNDNGPCPLLAICNVLLLRNNLNLGGDTTEVSQEKLLSLVAERLIDSNSNIDNKDAGYVENQQQNIADAIDLLPRLATGIDVNIKFRRIDDFEFTCECAIFDLLDIPLYHGWIVDPQDYDTANAIGSKSYNAIMSELVALETQSAENESKSNPEEDCVDFAAATTATLGVPSPCLSKNRSFDDSPGSIPDQQRGKKGDLEEEAELLRALRLSEAELPISVGDLPVVNADSGMLFSGSDGSAPSGSVDISEGPVGLDLDHHHSCSDNDNFTSLMTTNVGMLCSTSKTDQINYPNQSGYTEHRQLVSCEHVIDTKNVEIVAPMENKFPSSHEENIVSVDHVTVLTSQGGKIEIQPVLTTNGHEAGDISSTVPVAGSVAAYLESDASNIGVQNIDASENFTSSVDGSEPIYEGEECILDSGTNYEDREPMYEGEVILAEQADKTVRSKDEITPQQGELIRNFLKNSASQLTFYGLFCLQGGLKERELCVFFRNNHFSTMFKYNGELYLLATDQGYINQPDLVWEKLNEVNGDTLFMTGNFKEFKMESHANETWNEHNAMTTTADFLASIDTAAESGLDMNSDLQLAIALQQQEFEQQQPQRQSMPQTGKLITGPQVPSSSRRQQSSSSKVDAKFKEKCVVMLRSNEGFQQLLKDQLARSVSMSLVQARAVVK